MLPDLGKNIKCGNSLIGSDFYAQENLPTLDDEARLQINAFDWKHEFADIMSAGGFDAVIGNPPYGAELSGSELSYCVARYEPASKFPDSYCLFTVAATRLLRRSGALSFIAPNTFCDLENCDAFRRWLLQQNELIAIWQSGWAFDQAVVDTLVFHLRSGGRSGERIEVRIDDRQYRRSANEFLENELTKIDYRNTSESRAFLRRVTSACDPLSAHVKVSAGVKMYEKGKGSPPQSKATLEERPFSRTDSCPRGWQALYRGNDVTRHTLAKPKEFVHYGPWLAAPRDPALFAGPKLLMRRTDDRLMCAFDDTGAIAVNSCHVIKPHELSPLLLSGLLNSKLLQRVFEIQNPQMVGKVFAEIKVVYVERLPIPRIDLKSKATRAAHDTLVAHVERMLKLHEQLAAAKSPHEQTHLQRDIAATDRAIDQLVYQLYGLTPEEIALVEAATAPAATKPDTPVDAEARPTATEPATPGGGYESHFLAQEDPPES